MFDDREPFTVRTLTCVALCQVRGGCRSCRVAVVCSLVAARSCLTRRPEAPASAYEAITGHARFRVSRVKGKFALSSGAPGGLVTRRVFRRRRGSRLPGDGRRHGAVNAPLRCFGLFNFLKSSVPRTPPAGRGFRRAACRGEDGRACDVRYKGSAAPQPVLCVASSPPGDGRLGPLGE